MQFAGVLPEDAPDPRLESGRRLLGLTFPLMGLVPQPTIEDTDSPAIMETTGGAGRSQLAVSFSYTLWRNADDRADPVNLKDLDPHEQAAIDTDPPWPRPAWLIEYVDMMRYPQLWEAVRTCWTRDGSEHTTLGRQLIDHTNYILMNQFREELRLGVHDWDSPALTSERVVRHGVHVPIDGVFMSGAEIDTDPFVYAVGAKLPSGGTLTVVVPREHLPHLTLEFVQRPPT